MTSRNPSFVASTFTGATKLSQKSITPRSLVGRETRCRARGVIAQWKAQLPSDSSGSAKIEAGSVVVVALSASRRAVAEVTSVDSSGKNADILLLEERPGSIYVRERAVSTFEKTTKMIPILGCSYVNSQDGFAVAPERYNDALESLNRGQTAAVEQNKAKELTNELQSQKSPLVVRALIGAAVSVPIGAASYALYASTKVAYENNPDVPSSEQALRESFLLITRSFSGLSFFLGASLLVWALLQRPEEQD